VDRILAVLLGLLAFLAICAYWLWQIATGRPAIEIEEVAIRAVLAMAVTYVIGRFLGRLGSSLLAEACQESEVRRRDREMLRDLAAREAEVADGRQPGGPSSAEQVGAEQTE
jgi:hypothetical protein